MEKEFYTIGEVSKLCDIPSRTLHYYDGIGLLSPSKKDEKTGYRYYHRSQLMQINVINQCKIQGYSLKEIKEHLENKSVSLSKEVLIQKRKEIKNNIDALIQLQKRLDLYLVKLVDNYNKDIDLHIRFMEPMKIAYIREAGDATPAGFGKRFALLQTLIKQNNLMPCDTHMAIYYDDYRDYNIHQADIEVAVPVINESNDEYIRSFGGFEVVSALHYGSYLEEPKTYSKMFKFMNSKGYCMCGEPIERYLIDILFTDNPEEYITELIIPVCKKD